MAPTAACDPVELDPPLGLITPLLILTTLWGVITVTQMCAWKSRGACRAPYVKVLWLGNVRHQLPK